MAIWPLDTTLDPHLVSSEGFAPLSHTLTLPCPALKSFILGPVQGLDLVGL